jgi:glycosyltransferase involved in cell wall biosynthesis
MVFLNGWIYGSNKIEALKNANVFILPSHYEGYPNSLMEAMASGKACIATNIGSIPDMIENNVTGLLINPKNAIELFKSIELLYLNKNLVLKFGFEARKKIVQNNTLDVAVFKFNNLIN